MATKVPGTVEKPRIGIFEALTPPLGRAYGSSDARPEPGVEGLGK